MKMQQVREIAKKVRVKTANMKKADIVRAIQKAEGNRDCFGDGAKGCAETKCLWREDCQ